MQGHQEQSQRQSPRQEPRLNILQTNNEQAANCKHELDDVNEVVNAGGWENASKGPAELTIEQQHVSGNVDNGLGGAKLNCGGEVPSVCGHNVHAAAAAAAAAASFSTQQIKVVKQKASGKELGVLKHWQITLMMLHGLVFSNW